MQFGLTLGLPNIHKLANEGLGGISQNKFGEKLAEIGISKFPCTCQIDKLLAKSVSSKTSLSTLVIF